MPQLSAFLFTSLNGFYKGLNEDISWNLHQGDDELKFSERGSNSGSTLLFGRVTYQMMQASWTSEALKKALPKVAEGMNKASKIVFSRTLQKADWNNTRLIKGDLVEEVKKLKQQPGVGLTILGSGTILTQLAEAGLMDQIQILVYPVALPAGTPVFNGLREKLNLELAESRPFKSGSVLLTYRPK